MVRLLYTLVVLALLPWAILHLLWRSLKQPEYLRHWGDAIRSIASCSPT